jgi:hypothetical protein
MLVLLASASRRLADANRTSMINTYCIYTVLRYSWWWTVDLSQTCKVLYQINYIVHLVGFHYKNISRCTVHLMKKKKKNPSLHRFFRTGSGASPPSLLTLHTGGSFPWSEVARAVDLNTFQHLVASVRMSGAIPQLPYTSSCSEQEQRLRRKKKSTSFQQCFVQ